MTSIKTKHRQPDFSKWNETVVKLCIGKSGETQSECLNNIHFDFAPREMSGHIKFGVLYIFDNQNTSNTGHILREKLCISIGFSLNEFHTRS